MRHREREPMLSADVAWEEASEPHARSAVYRDEPFTELPRRFNVRFIGPLNGRYVLSRRGSGGQSDGRAFACRMQSITPRRLVLSAPVNGLPGDRAAVNFPDIGLIKVMVEEPMEFGFAASIEATPRQRLSLAKKIQWVKRRTHQGWPDQREYRRVIPRNPRSFLVLADGSVIDCFLIDISRSGAAVSADLGPVIGTPLAVGKVLARVVRRLEVGFAVQFLELQDPATLEERLARR